MSKTHGKRNTAEYDCWRSMKKRCLIPTYHSYKHYGGRGVKVCRRWLHKKNGFINFLSDMGERPSPIHSLDRFPDKNGNYEPTNCRWATPEEQQGNRRNNVWKEYKGIKMILSDWATRFGISKQTLQYHLKRTNKSFEDIAKYYELKNTKQ